jgi:hypothetical protein
MLLHRNRTKIIKIEKPNLEMKNYAGFNTGIRPYRKGGVRIELENKKNKTIIHNYGHGGGGVSLFFGSCKQAIEKFDNFLMHNKLRPNKVIVIGSG